MNTFPLLSRTLPLTLLLLASCAKEEMPNTIADRTGNQEKSGKPTPTYLVKGDPACFDVMRDCVWESATCNSNGQMWNQTSCSAGFVCAGGVAFLKGTGSGYGPWHTIQPRTRPNGYKCLRVRFKSAASDETVGEYNAATGLWTVLSGTNFQAQQVSPPSGC